MVNDRTVHPHPTRPDVSVHTHAIMSYRDTLSRVHREQNLRDFSLIIPTYQVTLTLHPREEHLYLASLKALTSKPNSNVVSGMTTRPSSQLLTTRWLSTYPVKPDINNQYAYPLRSTMLPLRNCDLSLTSTHSLAPLAYLCCWKCLYSTPKLKLVPLTRTRVWRNELYTIMFYG